MPQFEPDHEAERWARLWERSQAEESPWEPHELDAVWRHQMRAPVEGLWVDSPPRSVTCGELLHGSTIQTDGLRRLKEFARVQREHRLGDLTPELATVLYFAAIAAAWLRSGERLTGLPDDGLLNGFTWSAQRPWLDEATRDLLLSAAKRLRPADP